MSENKSDSEEAEDSSRGTHNEEEIAGIIGSLMVGAGAAAFLGYMAYKWIGSTNTETLREEPREGDALISGPRMRRTVWEEPEFQRDEYAGTDYVRPIPASGYMDDKWNTSTRTPSLQNGPGSRRSVWPGLEPVMARRTPSLQKGPGSRRSAWPGLDPVMGRAECAGVGDVFGMAESDPSKYMDSKWITTTDFLFHYTTLESAMNIETSGFINISRGGGSDARFGDGVYLTSLHPEEGRDKILKNNYDGKTEPGRKYKDNANYYFKFKKSDLRCSVRVVNPERDIWLCPHKIILAHVDYECGNIDANVEQVFDERTGALSEYKFTR